MSLLELFPKNLTADILPLEEKKPAIWAISIILVMASTAGVMLLGPKILLIPIALLVIYAVLNDRIFLLIFYLATSQFCSLWFAQYSVEYHIIVAILFIFLIFARILLGSREYAPPSRFLIIFFIVFLFLTILSDLVGGINSAEQKLIIRYFVFFPYLYLIYYICHPKDIFKIIIAVSIPLVSASIFLIWLYSHIHGFLEILNLYRYKPGGIFSNSNSLGGVLILITPLWIALAICHPQKSIRRISALLSILFVIGIVMSNARASMLGLAFSIILFSVLNKKIRQITICLGIVVVIALSLPAVRTLISVGLRMDRGTSARTEVWANTLNMILQHPLLGIGPGNYPAEYMKYYATAAETGFFGEMPHAHNFILDMTARLGIPGLIIALILYIFPIVLVFKILKKIMSFEDKWIIYGIMGSLFALYGFSIFEAGWIMGDGRSYPEVIYWIFVAILLKINTFQGDAFSNGLFFAKREIVSNSCAI